MSKVLLWFAVGTVDRIDTAQIVLCKGVQTMTSARQSQVNVTPVGVRRLGYLVGIAVSAVILFVANNLLEWDIVSFVTADFEQLLPIVNASLVTSIVVNAIWILYDAAWIRSTGQIILNLTSIAVLALTLRIFPFDFSPYSFDWASLTKVLLVFLIVALVIATIVEIVKLGSAIVNS